VLVTRTFQAADRLSAGAVVVGGGVAANALLRSRMGEESKRRGLPLYLTPSELATDNAVMIAGYGYPLFLAGRTGTLEEDAFPR
jgi:N6-L-threonylcarbamoyladenine synthase